ncbi:MAG: hypothetical protein WDM87_08970 [Terracidiphilus sp.]
MSLLLPVSYTATTEIMTPQQTQQSTALLMSQLALNPSTTSPLSGGAGGALSLRNPTSFIWGFLHRGPSQMASSPNSVSRVFITPGI